MPGRLKVYNAATGQWEYTSGYTFPTPVWIAPTFLNGWVNYGGSFSAAGYLKDALGWVHLKGLVKSGTNNSVVFVLPVGYRPLESLLIMTISNNLIGRVDIKPNGDVVSSTPSTNAWTALDNIHFLAEQ